MNSGRRFTGSSQVRTLAGGMNRRRRTLAVLVLISLLLLAFDLRDGGDGPLAVLQRGATALFGPIQSAGAAIVRPIGGFFSSIGDLGSLREENQLPARRERGAAAERGLAGRPASARTPSCASLLGAAEEQELVTTVGRVIASAAGRHLVVGADRRGRRAGCGVGMAVMTEDGFVGRVSEVTARYSRVLLASSPDAGFAVRVSQTGDLGLVTGQGSDPFRLELFDTDVEVPLDAEIVTQIFQGTLIPDGLPVGVLERPPTGITAGQRFLEVRPYVDFASLSMVLVVLNDVGPPGGARPRGADRQPARAAPRDPHRAARGRPRGREAEPSASPARPRAGTSPGHDRHATGRGA